MGSWYSECDSIGKHREHDCYHISFWSYTASYIDIQYAHQWRTRLDTFCEYSVSRDILSRSLCPVHMGMAHICSHSIYHVGGQIFWKWIYLHYSYSFGWTYINTSDGLYDRDSPLTRISQSPRYRIGSYRYVSHREPYRHLDEQGLISGDWYGCCEGWICYMLLSYLERWQYCVTGKKIKQILW